MASSPGSVKVDDALQTPIGGQGVVVFYGMAKPVRAPQIGPVQPMNEVEDAENQQILGTHSASLSRAGGLDCNPLSW